MLRVSDIMNKIWRVVDDVRECRDRILGQWPAREVFGACGGVYYNTPAGSGERGSLLYIALLGGTER